MKVKFVEKIFCSETRSLTLVTLKEIRSFEMNFRLVVVATKSKEFKNRRKWDTPIPSEENSITAEKIVDKTGKPKQIDDKMVKILKTPQTEE